MVKQLFLIITICYYCIELSFAKICQYNYDGDGLFEPCIDGNFTYSSKTGKDYLFHDQFIYDSLNGIFIRSVSGNQKSTLVYVYDFYILDKNGNKTCEENYHEAFEIHHSGLLYGIKFYSCSVISWNSIIRELSYGCSKFIDKMKFNLSQYNRKDIIVNSLIRHYNNSISNNYVCEMGDEVMAIPNQCPQYLHDFWNKTLCDPNDGNLNLNWIPFVIYLSFPFLVLFISYLPKNKWLEEKSKDIVEDIKIAILVTAYKRIPPETLNAKPIIEKDDRKRIPYFSNYADLMSWSVGILLALTEQPAWLNVIFLIFSIIGIIDLHLIVSGWIGIITIFSNIILASISFAGMIEKDGFAITVYIFVWLQFIPMIGYLGSKDEDGRSAPKTLLSMILLSLLTSIFSQFTVEFGYMFNPQSFMVRNFSPVVLILPLFWYMIAAYAPKKSRESGTKILFMASIYILYFIYSLQPIFISMRNSSQSDFDIALQYTPLLNCSAIVAGQISTGLIWRIKERVLNFQLSFKLDDYQDKGNNSSTIKYPKIEQQQQNIMVTVPTNTQ